MIDLPILERITRRRLTLPLTPTCFCAMAQVYDCEGYDLQQETEANEPWYKDQINRSPFQLVGKFSVCTRHLESMKK